MALDDVVVPTSGVSFNDEQIRKILASLHPPLRLKTYEASTLGFNNRVYFLVTECGQELVLKAGGRYWKRQKTEAEVAALLAVRSLCQGDIKVPRVVGFSSKSGEPDGLPHEWVLLEKLEGENLAQAWDNMSESQRVRVAEKLAQILICMHSRVTLQSLGSSLLKSTVIGNLSITPAEVEFSGNGFDHNSFPLSTPPLKGRLHVSRILNGPSASSSYLDYTQKLVNMEIDGLQQPGTRAKFANQLSLDRLPRLKALLGKVQEHPGLTRIDKSELWHPLFTHGDFQPQNILVSLPPSSSSDNDVGIAILDWEWAGFFPPHVEWDAGIDDILVLFGDSVVKSNFLHTLHAAGALTPDSAAPDDWECARKIGRLTECIIPWWLAGFPPDGGAGDIRKVAEEKRQLAAFELDDLLEFFGV